MPKGHQWWLLILSLVVAALIGVVATDYFGFREEVRVSKLQRAELQMYANVLKDEVDAYARQRERLGKDHDSAKRVFYDLVSRQMAASLAWETTEKAQDSLWKENTNKRIERLELRTASKSSIFQTASPSETVTIIGLLFGALVVLAGVVKFLFTDRKNDELKRELKESQEARVRDLKDTVADASVLMGSMKSSFDSLTDRIGDAISFIKK